VYLGVMLVKKWKDCVAVRNSNYRIYANTTVDQKIISKFTFVGLDSLIFQEMNFYR